MVSKVQVGKATGPAGPVNFVYILSVFCGLGGREDNYMLLG